MAEQAKRKLEKKRQTTQVRWRQQIKIHCTYRRIMAGHNRVLGSGRKGDPCNRTVIKPAMSLQNKCGNVRQHKSQVDAKHDPF
eukprot:10770021-Ditylum_brightwellii.AAC.1